MPFVEYLPYGGTVTRSPEFEVRAVMQSSKRPAELQVGFLP